LPALLDSTIYREEASEGTEDRLVKVAAGFGFPSGESLV
jgi:hypothetical protein